MSYLYRLENYRKELELKIKSLNERILELERILKILEILLERTAPIIREIKDSLMSFEDINETSIEKNIDIACYNYSIVVSYIIVKFLNHEKETINSILKCFETVNDDDLQKIVLLYEYINKRGHLKNIELTERLMELMKKCMLLKELNDELIDELYKLDQKIDQLKNKIGKFMGKYPESSMRMMIKNYFKTKYPLERNSFTELDDLLNYFEELLDNGIHCKLVKELDKYMNLREKYNTIIVNALYKEYQELLSPFKELLEKTCTGQYYSISGLLKNLEKLVNEYKEYLRKYDEVNRKYAQKIQRIIRKIIHESNGRYEEVSFTRIFRENLANVGLNRINDISKYLKELDHNLEKILEKYLDREEQQFLEKILDYMFEKNVSSVEVPELIKYIGSGDYAFNVIYKLCMKGILECTLRL